LKRKFTTYRIFDFTETRNRMLEWIEQFSIFCFLDNHKYDFLSPSFECLVGAGAINTTNTISGLALESLQQFKDQQYDWLFGHLSYDLKNEIENLSSAHPDHIRFPDLFFFVPEVVLMLSEQELRIGVHGINAEEIFTSIQSTIPIKNKTLPGINLKSRFSRKDYIRTVKELQGHMLRGDCYEINFCQEFYAENTSITPLEIYRNLCNVSPNPFAAFYKIAQQYLVCASPERYLKKRGNKIYSQPMKGTAKREIAKLADKKEKEKLYSSKKERAENVIVVDMVRNDLSKVCKKSTVKVNELFGIYSFPQVHQMVSTISGTLAPGKSFAEIINATFPMGSMTGAPKKRVMELIEKYERTKRGLFSGSVGYITPGGDFDFNVVIRSILYNAATTYLSIQAGSAITFSSDAKKEFEECLLKIDAMRNVLS
jgi:para-aminobenzoate synthetase component I